MSESNKVWRMRIKSQKAYGLSLAFSELYLSSEAKMYVFNLDGTMIYGPVTSKEIINGIIRTSTLSGEEVIIQIVEPINSKGKSHFILSKVCYCFRDIFNNTKSSSVKSIQSQPLNADCDNNWENESHGIVFLEYWKYNSSNGMSYLTLGSGALMNNTSADKKPYILTAKHVLTDQEAFVSQDYNNIQYLSVTFDYKKNCQNGVVTKGYSYTGATLRALNHDMDMALVELYSRNVHPNMTFLGWTRASFNPGPINAVCLHHRLGYSMEISTFNQFVNDYTYLYDLNLSTGVIDHGSSGSPVFDSNKKVFGFAFTMSGSHYYYVKFKSCWTGDNSNSTGLMHWLDPNGTNPMTLNFLKIPPNYTTQSVFKTIPVSQVENVYPLYSIPNAINYKWEWSTSYSSNDIRILNLTQNCAQYAQVVAYKPFSQTGMAYTLYARPVLDSYGSTPTNPTFIYTFQALNNRSYATAYPNPVSDVLYIKIEDEQDIISQSMTSDKSFMKEFNIRLYNGSGDLLRSEITKGEALQLNMSKYPTGYYYLHVHDNINKDAEAQKIVILKK